MKVQFKKLLQAITISLCALCAGFLRYTDSFATRSYPKPSEKFYVNDLANVIDAETEKYIIETNVTLAEKTGGQIVVMAVDSLDGEDIELYANDIFNQYEIGNKTKNNGTLILLSVSDRKSRIELGYGTEEFITSGASGRIQDQYMIPYFRNNNWNEGLRKGFDGVLAYYQKEYNITINKDLPSVETIESTQWNTSVDNHTQNNIPVAERIATILFFVCFVIGFLSRFKRIAHTICIATGTTLTFVPFLLTKILSGDIIFILLTIGTGLLFGAIAQLSGGRGRRIHHGSSGNSGGSYHGGGGRSGGGGSSRSF